MWIRVNLDIRWSDLLHGMLGALFARDAEAAAKQVESRWSVEGDGLACLSVRSALDLLFSTLDLPPGSEVLYSAVTIPDMVQVAREHGLVPVPVDLAGADLHLDLEACAEALTPKTRVLVVAHLFGARPDLTPVLEFAHEAGLFVIEDCAQAWCGSDYRGDPRADASLFSFGAIKTATALGGALARVSDDTQLDRMRELQREHPMESRKAFAWRVFEGCLQSLMSLRVVYTSLVWLAGLRGWNPDQLIDRLGKRFPGEGLMAQLRQHPCAAQLRLLDRRLRTYDDARIQKRKANAQVLIEGLGLATTHSELSDARHTFWLFAYRCEHPEKLVQSLWEVGVDSARYGSLELVPAPPGRGGLDCPVARGLLDQIVFLPCYVELPKLALARMSRCIAAMQNSEREV
jgi:perosamine synthetase